MHLCIQFASTAQLQRLLGTANLAGLTQVKSANLAGLTQVKYANLAGLTQVKSAKNPQSQANPDLYIDHSTLDAKCIYR